MKYYRKKGRLKLAICLALMAATLVVYLKVVNCEFHNYDDESYVTKNPYILAGLTLESVTWAFTSGYAANWHPLTWLSHMLDFKLYGLNPMGHHWTNLQIHILNSILLFLFLEWISGTLWRSAFVAALFAVHPLHVESVAWVAERKDLLCAFFWILSMWAYVRYVRHSTPKRYSILILFFVLGLMSKPMIVTLPFTLLLLDFWPLDRFQSIIQKQKKNVFQAILTLVREKIPLFVLSAISSLITFYVQQQGGAVATMEAFPLKARVSNAIISYTSYIEKMIWPFKLAILYPIREWTAGQVLISGILLLGFSVLAIRTWRRHPYFATGWFWYLGTLIPVIGLVQVGSQRMADRYTYIPLIGLFMIVAWGMTELSAKWPRQKIVLGMVSVAALLFFMVTTWFQVGYWQNGITLFKRAVNVTHNNATAYCGLGQALDRHGKSDGAIRCYLKTLQIDPNYVEAHFELGVTLEAQGRSSEALKHYFEALRIKPDYARVHNNIGVILSNQGKFDDAVYHFEKSLQISPNYPVAYFNLGIIFAKNSKFQEAIHQYQKALQYSSNMTQALYHLSWILASHEEKKYRNGVKAVMLAEKLCKITRNTQPPALDALAAAYAETGNFDAAVLTAQKGLQLALLHGPDELVSGLKERLQLYEIKKPYRQYLSRKNAS